MNRSIAVCADPEIPPLCARAEALAASLGLPIVSAGQASHGLFLAVTEERLELREAAARRGATVYADFVGGRIGHRQTAGGLAGQMLARAAGFRGKPMGVCDATAGLGRDAFLLAHLGCHVVAIERSPVIAALLRDGIERAAAVPALRKTIERLHAVAADAREFLPSLAEGARPDVVYLDPMFPTRKKSALVKKEMQICRLVAGDDPDAGELLDIAMTVAQTRVVVKRALHAPILGGKPSFTYNGTTVRYDVYVPRG